MSDTTTPAHDHQADAAAIIELGHTNNLSPETVLAIARSVTGLGPDVSLAGARTAIANKVGTFCYSGAVPGDLIAEIERQS